MRDLAKSALSFTWAMSLFGVKQMTGMMNPAAERSSFDAVASAAVDTLGDTLKSAYRIGDGVQRGAVEMAFSMMSGNWNPAKMLGVSSDAMQQAADATRQAAQAVASGTLKQGWGPVPPSA
jgi:hypothetical protein